MIGCKKDIDCVVLFSNDSDFKSPLKVAQQLGMAVNVFSPHESAIPRALRKNSNHHANIPPELLSKCRLPNVVSCSGVEKECPPEWR